MKNLNPSARFKPGFVNPFGSGLLLLLVSSMTAFAGSATWKLNPTNGDWNTAPNWSPSTVPDGAADIATFAFSNIIDLSLSASTEVNGVVFNAGASAFTITARPSPQSVTQLLISGVGITNDSGITQNFVTTVDQLGSYGQIYFVDNARAGEMISIINNGGATFFANSASADNGVFTNNAGAGGSGLTRFLDTSTAGDGTFTTNGAGFAGAYGGYTQFYGSSTAGNGTFTINGATVSGGANGGFLFLEDSSAAGNGTFTNNGGTVSGAGGGSTRFFSSSTAGSATLIANDGTGGGAGGEIYFFGYSTGGTARVEVFGNGKLDISSRKVTVGSIEGTGNIFLGRRNLTVGSNNLSTVFSGIIQDGRLGPGGSLTKIGTGKLTLTGANLYSGGTTIKSARLLVNNTSGSGTGTGPVFVNGGALGGNGSVAGAVTVGDGGGRAAFLAPGPNATVVGRLTIQSGLTFNSDATYKIQINSAAATTDKVLANGVTINTGAQFIMEDLGAGMLSPGTVFTIINNTAASPIAGRFSNLADGLTLTNNANTYRVNYQGGDGNDLTLTVQ